MQAQLENPLSTPQELKRGNLAEGSKQTKEQTITHINAFNPQLSHWKSEHAPVNASYSLGYLLGIYGKTSWKIKNSLTLHIPTIKNTKSKTQGLLVLHKTNAIYV